MKMFYLYWGLTIAYSILTLRESKKKISIVASKIILVLSIVMIIIETIVN